MFKKVYPYSEISEKIKKAIDLIADPIRQTMSPMGGNVVFEDDNGNQSVTNDGKTIAKYISVSDPIMDSVIGIIKASAMRTDQQAGDGTSSTIHLAAILAKGGLKLMEEGVNPMVIKKEFDSFCEAIKGQLKEQIKKVENDEDKFFIANVSANNDKKIADDTVKIVNVAGEDGLVFFVPSEGETKIIEDTGFNIKSGLLHPALSTTPDGFSSACVDCPVLITDKRLYYVAEAEAILKTVLEAGYKKVCIVARDFIGEAVPYLIANHQRGNLQVILVKDPRASENNSATLDDLATYLGGHVVSEKIGKLVDNLKFDDFVIAKKVFADAKKAIISRDKEKQNIFLQARIQGLKEEAEKDKDNEVLKERIASLTNGMVTVQVGGRTNIEVRERGFRYEDAVNATRQAMKHGYLVGGGIALRNAWKELKYICDPSFHKLFTSVCEANVRQIAINCGKDPDGLIESIEKAQKENNKNFGYNAVSNKIEDLIECGVIDPSKVTEKALDNAISIANVIVSSRYLVINDREWLEKNNQNKR